MDFFDTNKFISSKNVHKIELKIYRFYLRVIKGYFYLDKNVISIEKVDPNKGKGTYLKNRDLLNKPETLFLLSIQDTCIALRKFYNFLMEYIEVAKYLTRKDTVTIYCILGESLFAALGVCIVIDQIIEQYELSSKTCIKEIYLIITEKVQDRKKLLFYFVEKISSCFKNIKIELEFINERSDCLSVEVFRKLNEVDIVVMARYLSQYHYLTSKTYFVEVILKRMKELSILFYLDAFHKIYYDTIRQSISKTDSMIEIKSGKTVYEPLKDPGSKVTLSEFPILFNTNFKLVKFSTCIKCSGIKNKDSIEKELCEESRDEIKTKISERFEKENSPPAPVTAQASCIVFSLTSQYRTTCNKTGIYKKAKEIIIPSPSTSFNAFVEDNIQKTERFKKERNDSLTFPKQLNKNRYYEEKTKPNMEAVKTDKRAAKSVTRHSQNRNTYSSKNKSNAVVHKKNKGVGKLVPGNLQNIEQENHQIADVGRTTKDSTCLDNESESPCLEEEIQLSITSYEHFLSDIYYSKYDKEKPITQIVVLNKFPEMFDLVNQQTKNKYRRHRLKAKESSFSRYANFNDM